MEKITIKSALKLLRSGYVLESYTKDGHFIFVLEDNYKVHITSSKYSLLITLNEFEELYENFLFNLIENQDDKTINLEKDEEYYTRIQKHQ